MLFSFIPNFSSFTLFIYKNLFISIPSSAVTLIVIKKEISYFNISVINHAWVTKNKLFNSSQDLFNLMVILKSEDNNIRKNVKT